ncbi:chemotaxis protein CheW [Aestuariivita boseongensis]|uniref:chemotaxis protein CheW n=1 Tax=Aestuariivita boseongensis TaxID=1470562 RepID=UPI0006824472|nr:chemotaxis protein CheW [Aestuariivita boseongensis]
MQQEIHSQTDTAPIGLATVDGVPVDATETLLTFRMDGERFAIAVGAVAEIIDPQRTTRVPNSGSLAPSLLNVRGTIVPLIDLRHRLGMESGERLHSSRLLVIEIAIDGELTKIAIMADAVEDVIDAATAEVEPIPDLGVRWPTECFRGAIKHKGDLIILLEETFSFLDTRGSDAAL